MGQRGSQRDRQRRLGGGGNGGQLVGDLEPQTIAGSDAARDGSSKIFVGIDSLRNFRSTAELYLREHQLGAPHGSPRAVLAACRGNYRETGDRCHYPLHAWRTRAVSLG